MATVVQFVEIYRHRKAGTYSIQALARLTPTGGGWGKVGEPTVVGEEEFDERIVPAVLAELERSSKLPYDAGKAPAYSAKEYAEFVRSHEVVSVKRLSDGRLELVPLERASGGYKSVDEEIHRLGPEETAPHLRKAIREAFNHVG